ncbi:ImmA/IrrE family metallo-endopeptidase [Asticcacaulis taihuensis]|uniref:IrrE N-terminal-like domain-containing protein n=1 Tax=Asticcacaulis taihuensis TaxID=260084 RepID=A0A1G4SW10_9CAUL|nr:ImmA/IrrE family metallo-endopeptidase [Asticcacaulis taihuensis]SCW73231.1 protein of unknown function [Asticcacaulis taihuensis]
MNADTKNLVSELRNAGFTMEAIDAAWPSWWTDDAESSPSARTELRFALARKLGLSPKPLLGERVEFVWNDEARFKHLTAQDKLQQSVLSSFGVSIGRILVRSLEKSSHSSITAGALRQAILSSSDYVDLKSLISFCWSIGIPIIHLRVFPLAAKNMHAMVVSTEGQYAILLGKDDKYPAPLAFTLAHEIGHILLGHLANTPALVDMADPGEGDADDNQEVQANEFALELLTGSPKPNIQTEIEFFSARALAESVINAGPHYKIEPGTLALCAGYVTKRWPAAIGALRHIYGQPTPLWESINNFAAQQIEWDRISIESAEYLSNIMNVANG